MTAESTAWKIKEDMGGWPKFGTSNYCLSKLDRDRTKCYDPTTHEVHPCTEEKCPYAYELEAKKAAKEKAKQKKLF